MIKTPTKTITGTPIGIKAEKVLSPKQVTILTTLKAFVGMIAVILMLCGIQYLREVIPVIATALQYKEVINDSNFEKVVQIKN